MRIKICGVTTVSDGAMAADEGADMIGLVFAPGPRRVDVRTAREIVRRLPKPVEPVGVFQDQPLDQVRSILAETGLRTAQLHGQESPEFAASLGVNVIKTFTAFTDESLARLRQYDTYAFLLDVPRGSQERTAIDLDWAKVAQKYGRIVASGRITPESVFDVIRKLRPWAVDAGAFTDAVPGRKDRMKVRALIQAGRAAHADTEKVKVTIR